MTVRGADAGSSPVYDGRLLDVGVMVGFATVLVVVTAIGGSGLSGADSQSSFSKASAIWLKSLSVRSGSYCGSVSSYGRS